MGRWLMAPGGPLAQIGAIEPGDETELKLLRYEGGATRGRGVVAWAELKLRGYIPSSHILCLSMCICGSFQKRFGSGRALYRCDPHRFSLRANR